MAKKPPIEQRRPVALRKTSENPQWDKMRHALLDAGYNVLWDADFHPNFSLVCMNTINGPVIFQVWKNHGGFSEYVDSGIMEIDRCIAAHTTRPGLPIETINERLLSCTRSYLAELEVSLQERTSDEEIIKDAIAFALDTIAEAEKGASHAVHSAADSQGASPPRGLAEAGTVAPAPQQDRPQA